MRIFAFHLLNDFSGSPKVLMQLAKGWSNNGLSVTLVTARGGDGFLSRISGADYLSYKYRSSPNGFRRLFNYFLSQFLLFLLTLKHMSKQDVAYINTVLPFGAALAARLKGCKVIYHVHETSLKPAALKKFLFAVMKLTASEVIFVSNYLAREQKITRLKTHTLYNGIPGDFLNKARAFAPKQRPERNILMLCSLKRYKGVDEFVELARKKPLYNFRLVVSAPHSAIDAYFKEIVLPHNLIIFPAQADTHPFYQWADVILNLSRPSEWIEPFGLTVIEAMSYGLPVIVPPVGGIAELVQDDLNGHLADSSALDYISYKLTELLEDETIYRNMSHAARNKIAHFREDKLIAKTISILDFPRKQESESKTDTQSRSRLFRRLRSTMKLESFSNLWNNSSVPININN